MSKVISFQEVEKHTAGDDCWMVIDGKVYDVTKFLPEHPGGEEIVIDCGGTDATQAFDDIGHSEDAREMLKDMYIGDVDEATIPVSKKGNDTIAKGGTGNDSSAIPILLSVLVLLAGAAYFVLQKK